MKITSRRLSQMKPVLLDPPPQGDYWTYLMVRDLPCLSNDTTRADLTILRGRPLGREFNKTFGHCHRHQEDETYQVLRGRALFIIQKMSTTDQIAAIKIIHARAGDKVLISGDSYHNTVNLGRGSLIIINWLNRQTGNDYRLIEEKRGFGYYVIKGTANRLELIPNPNYKAVPKPIEIGLT